MAISQIVFEGKSQFSKKENHLAAVFNCSLEGMLTIDQAGNIFLFNSTAEKLFGYSNSEATEKNIKDLVPGLFKGVHNGHFKSLWDSSETIKLGSAIEVNAYRKDGTKFPAYFTFSDYWLDKERFFSVTVKNISEKKLTEAKRLHEIIFDQVKEGILGIDLDGKITFINAIGASLLGYEVGELKGRSFYSTIFHLKTITSKIPGDDHIILNAINDGENKTAKDQIFLNKFGSFISVDLKAYPVKEGNKVLGIVITFKNNELLVDTDLRTRIFFEMSKVISQSLSWEKTINQTLQLIGENLQWELANYWEIDSEKLILNCLGQWKASYLRSKAILKFQKISNNMIFTKGEGLPGEVWNKGQPVWISEIAGEKNFPREPFGIKAGLHSVLGSPVYAGDQIIGVFEFFSSTP